MTFRYLGDPPRETAIGYDVEIPKGLLRKSRAVHLEFISLNAELGRLVINGRVLQLPDSYNVAETDEPEVGTTVMSLPLTYFKSGTNTLVFEAGRGFFSDINVYDNYAYGEVVLIFSH